MFGKSTKEGYTEVLSGISVKTLCYGNNSLMTEFLLAKGAILTEHSHMHEQTGYLVSGKIRLYIHESSRVVVAGDSWSIPANVTHKADIIE